MALQPFGAFTIHNDNAENLGPRKNKAADLQGKPPATKRAALGTITNIQRVQPVRNSKQTSKSALLHNEENVAPKNRGKIQHQPPFSISIDEQETKPVSQSLCSATSLGRPLVELQLEAAVEESPMVLDTSVSCKESTEREIQSIYDCSDYQHEIYSYLRLAEEKYRPKVGYMKKQPDINNSMRSILVDWLVEVAEEYRLHRETMCLAVNYIDRFLSHMSVLRGKLQLVGAASIFLASKYEEIYPPEVGEFVYITDDTYTKRQVLKMEHLVLKVLSFDVTCPTVNLFCEKFMHSLKCSESDVLYNLAMYICELSLIDAETFLKFVPSEIAASACCLGNHFLNKEAWPPAMIKYTGYTYENIEDCVKCLYKTYVDAPSHPQQAVQEKYRQSKYKEVSTIPPAEELPYQ